jgi:type VI secretion system secreted protein Hcp
MSISAYLKLERLKGECQVKGHEEEIELLDWEWGSNLPVLLGSQARAQSYKIEIRPLTIHKYVDKTSPSLFKHCASGTAFMTGCLTLSKAIGLDSHTFDFFKLDLALAFVQSIALSKAELPVEQVAIGCGYVRMTYTPLDPRGNPLGAVVGGWDVIRNVAWDSGPARG